MKVCEVIDVPHRKDLLADDYRKQAVSANRLVFNFLIVVLNLFNIHVSVVRWWCVLTAGSFLATSGAMASLWMKELIGTWTPYDKKLRGENTSHASLRCGRLRHKSYLRVFFLIEYQVYPVEKLLWKKKNKQRNILSGIVRFRNFPRTSPLFHSVQSQL